MVTNAKRASPADKWAENIKSCFILNQPIPKFFQDIHRPKTKQSLRYIITISYPTLQMTSTSLMLEIGMQVMCRPVNVEIA